MLPGLWMPKDSIRSRYSPLAMHLGTLKVYLAVDVLDRGGDVVI